MRTDPGGYATPLVMGFIIALSIILGGIYLMSAQQRITLSRIAQDLREEGTLYEAYERIRPAVFDHILKDSNSRFGDNSAITDAVESFNAEAGDSRIISWRLTDVSSLLNINWIHPKFLQEDHIREILGTIDEQRFIDIRHAAGLQIYFPPYYEELFEIADASDVFTPYGVANIDVSHADSLRALALARTGDEEFAEALYNRINEKLSQLSLWTEPELTETLHPYERTLYTLINRAPMYNVNYLPEGMIRGVLHYKYGELESHQLEAAAEHIITLRDRQEIDDRLLADILDLENAVIDNPLVARVASYLGTRTWFWRLEIENEALRFSCILFRSPIDDAISLIEYSVSEAPRE
jgi:hypothetical protein